jgi:hypothetical protein
MNLIDDIVAEIVNVDEEVETRQLAMRIIRMVREHDRKVAASPVQTYDPKEVF